MSEITSCPVGYTCDTIDVAQSLLVVIGDEAEPQPKEKIEDLEDRFAEIRKAASQLDILLEEIRDANSKLREWGESMCSIAEDLETKIENVLYELR